MSNDKLNQAKELIQNKQYKAARAILRTVDNPTSRTWLARLDEIDPPPRRNLFVPFYLAGIIAALIIGVIIGRLSVRNPEQIIVASAPTNSPSAADDSTSIPTEMVLPTLTPTDEPPTNTPTSTFTLEPTSTSTVTNTPLPTNTPQPTRTPAPTRTPIPTETPFATQVASIGPIYDSLYEETYNVAVELQNVIFFDEAGYQTPGRGKIYVVAEVVVRNLGPGSLRSISNYDFQIKDANGAIRDSNAFLFSDCTFDMVDLTAQGSIEGCLSFEVPDTGSLELIYAPFQFNSLESGRYISFSLR